MFKSYYRWRWMSEWHVLFSLLPAKFWIRFQTGYNHFLPYFSVFIFYNLWVMQPVLMKNVISFPVEERDCCGPPHSLGVIHETLWERAAPEEWLSRRLGVDCTTFVWLCDSRVSPGDGAVSVEAFIWLPGKLRSCRMRKPCPSVLMILLWNPASRYQH
jgi:hypothetical protein